MKKTRSRTSRDFIGGFCGGSAGILAGWCVHPAALVVGCLVGFVCGFYGGELWRIGVGSYNCTLDKIEHRWSKVPKVRFDHLNWVTYIPGALYTAAGFVVACAMAAGRAIPTAPYYVRIAACHFIDVRQNWLLSWLARRTYHRILALRIVTGLIFAAVNLSLLLFYTAAYPGEASIEQIQKGQAHPGSDVFCIPILLTCYLGIPTIAFAIGGERADRKQQQEYVHSLIRRWDTFGWLSFLVYDVFALIRMELLLVATVLVVIFGGMAGIVAFIAIGLPIIAAGLFILRVAAFISSQNDHWLGCAVTLIVTAASFASTQHLMSTLTIGFISLSTGVAAGLSCVGVKRLTDATFRRFPAVRESASESIRSNVEAIGGLVEKGAVRVFWIYVAFVARQRA